MEKKGKFYIGTSGWSYPHWENIFYPQGLSQAKRLAYFSRYFNTVEINYSFYHLPSEKAFLDWYNQTPSNFVFALKLSRFITHIKRLKGIKASLNTFLERAVSLRKKLGPILVQFPPNFKWNETNQKRLVDLFNDVKSFQKRNLPHFQLKLALEFRDNSWFCPVVYKLLSRFNVALVFSDSSVFPKFNISTADFIYIRMHGPTSLFSSKYSYNSLRDLSHNIAKFIHQGLDVYCYFNNDFSGFAIENAKYLSHLLKR